MESKVLTDELWPTITRLARRSSRRHVAVAYLGQGATKILPLGKGDSIVVDMSLPTVSGGQTNPWEVEKYLKKGVSVFTCANLHAKIYLLGNSLIIGSANLSRHSRNSLVEAGLLTRDRSSLVEARGWIKDLQREPVSHGYLQLCKRAYKPSGFRVGMQSSKSGIPTPLHSELWLAGVGDYDFNQSENRLCEVAEQRLEGELDDPRSHEITHLHWTRVGLGVFGKEGDLVVQIWSRGRSADVYPPARILGVERYRKGSGNPVMIHLEEAKHAETLTLQEFRKAVKAVELGRVGPWSDFSVKSPVQRRAILGLWS